MRAFKDNISPANPELAETVCSWYLMVVEDEELVEVSFFFRVPSVTGASEPSCDDFEEDCARVEEDFGGRLMVMVARSSFETPSGTRISQSSCFAASSASKAEAVCFLDLYSEKSLGGL